MQKRKHETFKLHQPMWKYKDSPDVVDVLAGEELDPLAFFCPNGGQDRFIQAIAHSNADTDIPVVLATYANGVGKTTVTIHAILNMIYGVQNGWFDYPLFHNYPYPKVIWYCSTAEALKNTVIPEVYKLIKPNTYIDQKEGKPHISRIEFENGWQMMFKTYDQDVSTYESATVGCIVADEPMPEHLWKAVKSRRRKGAVTLLPMTPLYTPPYLLDEVQSASTGVTHLKADIYEACKERGVRGHLDAKVVDDLVAGYDPEERQARAFGEFAYFSGRIYPDLSRDIHLVDPSEYPIPPGSRIFHSVDPHDSRPSAMIWGALTPTGRRIVFAESPSDVSQPFWTMRRAKTIAEEVQEIIDTEANNDIGEITRIIDRHFGFQTRGQSTLAELYAKAGKTKNIKIVFMPSYTSQGSDGELQYGHRRVRQSLKLMDDGKPGLVIWNTCYHTWNGMSHYIRKHEVTKAGSDKPAGEGKIVEKYKDFNDVVRYFVCSNLPVRTPKVKKTPHQKQWDKIKTIKKTNSWLSA